MAPDSELLWRGKRVHDMTREELLEVVEHTALSMRDRDANFAQERAFLRCVANQRVEPGLLSRLLA